MITPSFNLTATERVLPRLALDFTTAVLDPRITFTRSGNTATYTDISGYVASAGVDVPRFDYDPVALACKGLLIEEARTNLFTYSSDYTTNWVQTKLTEVGTITSPDNTNTGYKLAANTETSTHYITQNVSLTSGTVYTFSVYAKAAEKTNLQLRLGTTNDIQITFNVNTGAITSTVAGTGTITDVGNGWYRCTATATCTSTASLPLRMYIVEGNNTTLTFAGNDSDGLYIWGAQLEAGAFVTSYIPTVASQVTRTADVATMTGTNFSDWYVAGAGGIVGEVIPSTVSGTRPIAQFDDTTSSEVIALRGNTTNPELYIVDSGTPQVQIDAGTISANTVYNLGAAWNTDNCAAAVNGGAAVTDTSATLPTVTQARLGNDGTNYLNGQLQNVRYWPQRLIDAEVQAFSK